MSIEPEYIEGNGFVAEIIRSHRKKTAQIKIEEGVVSVVAPKELSLDKIKILLKNKKKWIKEKQCIHQEAQHVSNKEFVSGEQFAYLGKHYKLKVITGPYKPVKLISGYLVTSTPNGSKEPHIIRNALIRWYKTKATERLNDKVNRLSTTIGVKPSSVSLQAFKSRWGSCTPSGELIFNWKIIMAPSSVCDYVVAHELCHLVHHDHSERFWKKLEQAMPDYQRQKEQLRDIAHRLDI